MVKKQEDSGGDAATPEALPMVAIGASAGGLAAFERLFAALPGDTGGVYVVVQHLSQDQKSELPSILGRYAAMPVEMIDGVTEVKPDHIYVLPAAHTLRVEGDRLLPAAAELEHHQREPINYFFEALAEDRREQAIAVVLSGSRDDGARGLESIKKRGGVTLAQLPEEADYESMPKKAIETGNVDRVLKAGEIGACIGDYLGKERLVVDDQSLTKEASFEAAYRGIVGRLKVVTGHNFINYKRSTMLRRIERRMRLRQIDEIRNYHEELIEHSGEVRALFEELLITVTEFFRDPEAFEALQKVVIAELFEDREEDEPIRVWVPACSTGEEVYSIGMLIVEEAARRGVYADFKIFATDLDESALGKARKAVYSEAACAQMSDERRDRYMVPESSGGYRVVNEIRERVLFAVHDILKEPPFARQDLVSCRNLLIYLENEAQRQVFEVLHYSLKPKGRLFLGASEFIGEARDLFKVVDRSNRIYRPKSLAKKRLPLSDMISTGLGRSKRHLEGKSGSISGDATTTLEYEHHRVLNHTYAPPSVLVNRDYEIIHVAGRARNYLRIPPGQPTHHILESVPTELRLQLRSALVDVFDKKTKTTTGEMVFERGGQSTSVTLVIQPMESAKLADEELAQIVFESSEEPREPVSVPSPKPDDVARSVVEKMERENKRLSDELRVTVERYETTTEELKTSNEELLTINEELQSTTEELETSKEELESTNEELTAVNDELSAKIAELDRVNSDLRNLLSSTEIGTIFLGQSLEVKRFTAPVQQYFNLLESDMGRPLHHITHKLVGYDDLVADVHYVYDQLEPIERQVYTEDGGCFIARIHPYRTVDDRIAGAVLTFFDITERRRVQRRLEESELLFRSIFDSASDILWLFEMDEEGAISTFTKVNEAACMRLGYSEHRLMEMTLADVIDESSLDLKAYLETLQRQGEAIEEVKLITREGERIEEEMNSRLMTVDQESRVVTISRDISAHKAQKAILREAKEESERLAEMQASFLANMSHEIRTPLTSIIGVSQLLAEKSLPDRQREMVELIRTSGRRLQQTLDSVLDISRLEAGEMTPTYQGVTIGEQIAEDVEILRPLADEKGVVLHRELPQEAEVFWTDPGFLSRIIYNLTQNAIKFSSRGEVVCVTFERDGDRGVVSVKDEGIGIDEAFLPHLFEKFKQASIGVGRDYEGSGLGLSLVQHLVEMMDGAIEVRSTKGEGTTFRVVLPEQCPSEESGD